MPVTNVKSEWVSGNLVFYDESRNIIFTIDGANRSLVMASGATIDLSLLSPTVVALITTGALTVGTTLRRSIAVPAAAGTNQATATNLTTDFNAVTAADGTKGVELPVAVAGMSITVINTDTAQDLKVYPATGAAINAIAANSALVLPAGHAATFAASSTTQWYTALTNGQYLVQTLADGIKIARSATAVAVTGTSDVTTGLATIIACFANAESDFDGDTLSAVQAVNTGGAGHILLKCWKVTVGGAAGNPTLIAATVAKNVDWFAVGT